MCDMGRPPCCDKVGVKKGPWTPEEDIMLVTYVQEHGPGNWRAVPTNTGFYFILTPLRLINNFVRCVNKWLGQDLILFFLL